MRKCRDLWWRPFQRDAIYLELNTGYSGVCVRRGYGYVVAPLGRARYRSRDAHCRRLCIRRYAAARKAAICITVPRLSTNGRTGTVEPAAGTTVSSAMSLIRDGDQPLRKIRRRPDVAPYVTLAATNRSMHSWSVGYRAAAAHRAVLQRSASAPSSGLFRIIPLYSEIRMSG